MPTPARQDPVVAAFRLLVRREPERALVVSPRSRATAADVEALARLAARRLDEAGIGAGALVGLRAPNGPGFLGGLVGIRERGATVLLLDAAASEGDSEAAAARFGAAGILDVGSVWPGPGDVSVRAAARSDRPVEVGPAAAIKLTSGSSGLPRGVAVTAEALAADDAALRSTMGIARDDRLLAAVPLSHSYGLVSLAVPALTTGVALVVPDAGGAFAPLDAAMRCEATVIPTVPAYLGGLVRLGDPPPVPPGLRLVLSAGAPLAPEIAGRFRERFGLPVHVFYGASECGGIAYDREGGAAERGTVGTPVDGVTVELVGDEASPAPGGRVVVRSPACGSGYLPEPDPARLGDGRFVSSDLGTFDGGELRLGARVDDVINVRGRKIHPAEIERVIASLPGVDDVRVVGVVAADGETALRAVVACRRAGLDAADVVAWCRARLSAFKVPRAIAIVDDLPRNARGKVDRAALSRM